MKMTYKNLNGSELKESLKSLLPEAKEFEVELSFDGNAPAIVCKEVMSLENILELVEKQGFKVNDINGVNSGGKMRDCVGITLNKPFIHDKTKESIEGLFILGNVSKEKITNSLYSFLIRAEKNYPNYSRSIDFSVDIVAQNIETAKSSFFEKIASFKYLSKEEEINFIPVTFDDGEWVEMEPEEDEDEIRFQIEDLTLEKINKIFLTIEKLHEIEDKGAELLAAVYHSDINEEQIPFSDNVLDHRPNLENLKAIGKENDYVFQALAYMGDASHFMSWANTVLEHVEEVPEELKEEIKKVHSGIWEMQERLRAVEGN